jgi:hypothetical protein
MIGFIDRLKLWRTSCVSGEEINYLLEETSAIRQSNGNGVAGSNQFQEPFF